jgi:prepilin-type N-terminal cleavage/methylation domain-containing protein
MKGFTLIETMVSVAIFSVVMVIALGALLAISASDRKAENLKSVINNLNFALDSMSRAIRTGSNWSCGVGGDCWNTGSNTFTFLASNGQTVSYRLESLNTDAANAASVCGQVSPNIGCIAKSINNGAWLAITAPEVIITDFSGGSPASYLFYVNGSSVADTIQPIVVITISGYVNLTGGVTSQAACNTTNGTQCSIFHLQTAITQRIYDQ